MATSESRNGARGARAGVQSERRHTHTVTRLAPADREPMVCGVQVDEVLDPRCYATVGIEPRTRALLTAVPYGGALLREGRSSRRQRPFWAVTLRAVDGPAAGVHAELRLWPESNPAWFQGRLALLCDSELETIDALSLDEQRALARAQPGGALLRGDPRDGRRRPRRRRLPRGPARARRAPARPAGASRRRGACRLRPMFPRRPFPTRPSRSSRTPRRWRPCASSSRPRVRSRSTSRPTAGRSGAPDDWSPADGAVRLLQVAARSGGEIVCGVVDCYARRAAPAPAHARRRPRDHRPQRALRAVLADLPVRPARLGGGLRHELRVPRLRAALVDPGSGLRASRRDARDRHAAAARARPRATTAPPGGAPSRSRPTSSTTPPTTRSR